MKVGLFILASCLLTISCEKSDADTIKEVGLVTFKGIQGALSSVPFVNTIVNGFAPFVEYLIGQSMTPKESAELKAIQEVQEAVQKGFKELSKKLDENMGKVHIAVELDKVRDAENKASILMQYLGDIVYANTTSSKNSTIHAFLDGCKKNDPYETVLQMTKQISKALRLTYKYDLERRVEPLVSMQNKLYGILHELNIAAVFQELLSNKAEEDRKNQFAKLERKMEEIRRQTKEDLEELAKIDIWPEMREKIESKIKEALDYEDSLTVMFDDVWEYVSNLYANDNFCVMASDSDVKFLFTTIKTRPEDSYGYDSAVAGEKNEMLVLRSRQTVMNFTERQAIQSAIEKQFPKAEDCWSDYNFLDEAAKYGQVIMYDVTVPSPNKWALKCSAGSTIEFNYRCDIFGYPFLYSYRIVLLPY